MDQEGTLLGLLGRVSTDIDQRFNYVFKRIDVIIEDNKRMYGHINYLVQYVNVGRPVSFFKWLHGQNYRVYLANLRRNRQASNRPTTSKITPFRPEKLPVLLVRECDYSLIHSFANSLIFTA